MEEELESTDESWDELQCFCTNPFYIGSSQFCQPYLRAQLDKSAINVSPKRISEDPLKTIVLLSWSMARLLPILVIERVKSMDYKILFHCNFYSFILTKN